MTPPTPPHAPPIAPHVIAVIPARYDSTRFPGKVLADRTGKPMIQHVWERVNESRTISRVIIATDDERIAAAVRQFGGEVAMTRHDHPNGTSRIAEIAQSLDGQLFVNVQGDEPEVEPSLVDAAVNTVIANPDCPMGTLGAPFTKDDDPENPNIVKVEMNADGRAVNFSRDFNKDSKNRVLKHVGLYVYRRDFLSEYVTLPATPREQAERLEQLRALEHGFPIAVAVGTAEFHGIDTPEQYEAFVMRWNKRQVSRDNCKTD